MKKGTLIAVGVFAVLLLAMLATREKEVRVGLPKLELASLDKAKVVSITVTGASKATLEKVDAGWLVSDGAGAKHDADENQVNGLLSALSDFRATDFVSEKPEKHAELELDDAKGLAVEVKQDSGAPWKLVFGKAGKSGGSYVRQPGANPVFLTSSPAVWQLRKDANGWRKRSVLSVKADEVSHLTVTSDDGSTWSASRKDAAWALDDTVKRPAGFRFDPMAPQQVVGQLTNLTAQDFAGAVSDDQLGLVGAHWVIELTKKDGKTVKLHLGHGAPQEDAMVASAFTSQFDAFDALVTKDGHLTKEEILKVAADSTKPANVIEAGKKLVDDQALFDRFDVGLFSGAPKDGVISLADLQAVSRAAGTVPARLEGDPQVYLLSNWSGTALKKPLDGLRDLTMFSFDPAKATKLTITVDGKKTVVSREGATWKLVEPKTAPEFDASQVPAQLAWLQHLRAARLLEGGKVGKAVGQVEVELEGGAKQSLQLGAELTGDKGLKQHAAVGAIDALTYGVDPVVMSKLKSGVDLFKKPAPPPNLQNMQGLDQLPPEVRKQLEAQLRSKR